MDYKYDIGETIMLDGLKVATIVDREDVKGNNYYTIRFDGAGFYKLTVPESRLEAPLPGRLIKCECGADAILGPYNGFHADYCGKYVPNEYNKKST
jgi:hypothetical protein